ncbi:MAG: amino acid adenylation domain-containing protein, partial [Caldilineaceae bacterium]|nr:amino acid adenylation domain-containing protein [Caldilineaceae bacterium]
LADAPPLLSLPTDRPRPAVQTFRGGMHSMTLSAELSTQLQGLSQREGVTLYMVLLAAFNVLLMRYATLNGHPPDIVVGSPIANRTHQELEALIGFFVNTLALRTDLSGNPTFQALLARVQRVTLDAYRHQDVPFEKVVEALQPERHLGYSPLVQVMFVWQNAPTGTVTVPELSLEPLPIESPIAKFDLTLYMQEGHSQEEAGGLQTRWEYNRDLYNADTIERMAGHFQTLLEAIVANPNQAIEALPLLTGDEERQLLAEWVTGTARPSTSSGGAVLADKTAQCIHQLFEQQAIQTPDAIAVLLASDTIDKGSRPANRVSRTTFHELNERANQLAHHLRSIGVGPEVLVGIAMERSIAMMVGLLGILKAGGAYVPLDPAYPRERLAYQIEDAAIQFLITERYLPSLPVKKGMQVIQIDRDWPQIAQQLTSNPAHITDGLSALYVLYTSGSTGKPKGVVGLHQGAVNRFQWMWDTYPFGANELCAQKTTLNFVDSVWEIWGPLLQGIPLVLIPDEVVKDPIRLVETLATHKVTRLVLVPSLLNVILQQGSDLQERLPALTHWTTSGEALSTDLYERFHATMPGCTLLNIYGSSEVSADVTCFDTSEGFTSATVPIGRPIANMKTYILDETLQPVPVGMPGELYVAGVGLARRYLGNTALTEARFVPNPFSSASGSRDARLFKTGDMARWLPTGSIEFLGRRDNQVKLRGIRIELGEIEATLQQHPAVNEAIVIVRDADKGPQQLRAYWTSNGHENEPKPANLRSFLQQQLPEYMIPAMFTQLAIIPLTPNGKVDRLALRSVEELIPAETNDYVAPRTAVEQQLAAIWQTVLGIEQVGVHDNFLHWVAIRCWRCNSSVKSKRTSSKLSRCQLFSTGQQLLDLPRY